MYHVYKFEQEFMVVSTDWHYYSYTHNIHEWYLWLYICPIQQLNVQVSKTSVHGLEYCLYVWYSPNNI